MSARSAREPIRVRPATGVAGCDRPSPMPISSAVISIPITFSAVRTSWTWRRLERQSKRISPARLGSMWRGAAAGITRIVDMRMADAVRVFAAKRGIDLSAFTLLPFGGAGGVHAAAVASELGMRRILVPPQPGAFSALGLLCTDVVHDYMRSELRPLAELSAAHAEQIFQELEKKARDELDAEGMDSGAGSFARELDLRYSGQGYELRIPLPGLLEGGIAPATLSATRRRFDTRHAELHAHPAQERPVEVVSYRLRLRLPVPKYEPRKAA